MYLQKLYLQFFRSYEERLFEFDTETTVLVGPNAIGKTNILEAIYLLSTGNSFRADKVEEMVAWDEEVGHIAGRVRTAEGEDVDLRVTVTTGMVQGKKVRKRKYAVNGVGKQKKDFVGRLKAVVFLPEDLELISGSPGLRRRYMDDVLTQVDSEYRQSLSSYEKGLKRRNKLLDALREGKTKRSALTFWDQLILKHGEIITSKREELIDYINEKEWKEGFEGYKIEYDPSPITEARLKKYAHREVAAGYTLIGPHRDDFRVRLDKRLLDAYGSRGQQRMGVLWLKMSQLFLIKERVGQRPILLLDDIFSELDEEHEQEVMKLLGQQQSIITTTEAEADLTSLGEVEILELRE